MGFTRGVVAFLGNLATFCSVKKERIPKTKIRTNQTTLTSQAKNNQCGRGGVFHLILDSSLLSLVTYPLFFP
jgi:hypothetical protein